MQCDAFEDRLNRLLDHRMVPAGDESLLNHARQCDSCAATLRASERLFNGLRQSKPMITSAAARRVVRLVHREPAQPNPSRTKYAAFALATAVCVAVLLVSATYRHNTALPVASKNAFNLSVRSSAGHARRNQGMVATTKVAPLRTVAYDTDANLNQYSRAMVDLAVKIGGSPEFDDMSETLSPSIRPIQFSFGLALDALRRTLPRGKEMRSAKPESGAWFHSDFPSIG